MYAFGTADLTGVLFQNNLSTIGTGGGVYSSGRLDITQARFIRNRAAQGGGLSHTLGDATMVNSLLAGNSAISTAGQALLLASAGQADLVHITIASPTATTGSAIAVTAGSSAITNTIITSHTVGIVNFGASVREDFNLFFGNGTNTQGGVSGGANSTSGDPMFVNPAGVDYHLRVGSAAGDAGTNAGLSIDFDGDARPTEFGFEIGFDEAYLWPYKNYLPLTSK
jgi:hypothetical protein